MKVSVITVCLNSKETITQTLKSIQSQDYDDIEHLIIDGVSTDGTIDIIKKHESKSCKLISEPDKGLYDAMNKGISKATGDIIGILNADDFYASFDVVSKIVELMESQKLDAAFGDLVYVDLEDISKEVRFWKASNYMPGAFRMGWVPPHPTFFCRREIYERYGNFREDMKIAADFELLLRFIARHKIKVGYLPHTIVKMRTGGKAYDWKGRICGNIEIFKAFHLNNLKLSQRAISQRNFKDDIATCAFPGRHSTYQCSLHACICHPVWDAIARNRFLSIQRKFCISHLRIHAYFCLRQGF